MPVDRTTTEPPSGEFEHTEARMRQALGLRQGSPTEHPPQQRPEQARPKHRFARDGEVPVVVLHNRREADSNLSSPRNRVAALEALLQSERAGRSAAERSLAEAVANVQSLRTKLAHSELAHREALAAAQASREQAEQALQEVLLAKTAAEKAAASRAAADQALADRAVADRALADRSVTDRASADRASADGAVAEPPKKRLTRLRKSAEAPRVREPKPVKWWVPSFRTKSGKA